MDSHTLLDAEQQVPKAEALMADTANLATTLYEAWNRRDFDTLADLTALDGEIVGMGPGDTPSTGPRAPSGTARCGPAPSPDGSNTVDRVTAAGEPSWWSSKTRAGRTTRCGYGGSPGAGVGW